MEVFVAVMAMMSFAFVALCRLAGSRRKEVVRDGNMRAALGFLLSAFVIVLFDVLASGKGISLTGVAVDILPSVVCLWLLASSLAETRVVGLGIGSMILSCAGILVFHVCRIFTDVGPVSFHAMEVLALLIAGVQMCIFVSALALQMKDVKSLMKKGTAWPIVCQTVDVVYFCFVLSAVALVRNGASCPGVLVLTGVAAASGRRIFTDSRFIIWQKQETLIVESLKLSSLSAAADSQHGDDMYKELYERIVLYFDENKPYLDSELTINDLVKNLYSNKLYISKAISQFTGRNFCQFVNHYRVVHSMECFRKNHELRINELANLSGFNSVVSYSMAFRLFMGENPSEWSRKERSRLLKKGK